MNKNGDVVMPKAEISNDFDEKTGISKQEQFGTKWY